jgi:hypothetical protein
MGNWAKETAERLKAAEAIRDIESERFTEEQRLRKHLAPRKWMEVRDLIKGRCAELNTETGRNVVLFELQPSSSAVVRRLDKTRVLVIEFESEAFRLFWQCGDQSGEYMFRVNTDTSIDLTNLNGVPYSASEVGETLLDSLLG